MPRIVDAESWSNATVKSLLTHAETVVAAEVAQSPLLRDLPSPPQPWDPSHMKIGRVVGRGGFCVVSELRELRKIPLRDATENSSSSSLGSRFQRLSSLDQSTRSKKSNTSSCHSEGGGDKVKPGKYVVKQVNPDLILQGEKVTFLKGVIDIALEAKFLIALQHPNIIELRGESSRSPFETTDYFVILEYLPETLPNRLNLWMHTQRTTQGITGFMTSLSGASKERKVARLLTERLGVAYDIAAAGDYLHSRQVIFRDFKPDNVGFSAAGVTKLMDFGLARELTQVERDAQGLYLLTGLTGGIRYMAPEVGLSLPYNTQADIYSWSMILWYILALEPPLCLYTPEMIMYRVFEKGHRPATKVKWSPVLSALLRRAWSEDPHERPTFAAIMTELTGIMQPVAAKDAKSPPEASEASF